MEILVDIQFMECYSVRCIIEMIECLTVLYFIIRVVRVV